MGKRGKGKGKIMGEFWNDKKEISCKKYEAKVAKEQASN